MARHSTERRSAAVGPRSRRLWLEQLEGREAPSLLFDGLPTTPFAAPLAPVALTAAEPPGPPATRTAAAPEDWTDAGAEDLFWTPAVNSRSDRFAENQAVDFGAAVMGSTNETRSQAERPGPVIVDFYASEGKDGWWTFTGRVDAGNSGGLIVSFGGLNSLRGRSVEVNEDGTFSITIQLQRTPICEEGLVTAQAIDLDDQASNVAEDYVYQTSCPR